MATIEETAQELLVSTQTVRRYLRSGKLSGQKINGRWLINLPEEQPEMQEAPTSTDTQSILEALRAERDWLRRHIDELTLILQEVRLQGLRESRQPNLEIVQPHVTERGRELRSSVNAQSVTDHDVSLKSETTEANIQKAG